MYDEKIRALRMERQHLLTPANETEYDALYRDLQPGQNVCWNGFGQPPTLSFRADFDDLAYNKSRQFRRELIKGRFAGGNLGWILPEDLELFAALYRKPLKNATMTQQMLLERIEMSGPYTIGQLKEESGLLVKEITPALHRLQEAFLIYEDQYDGEWDRGWYRFDEFFSDFSLDRYTKTEALKIVLRRFAHRFVWFTPAMAKSFYKLPEKEIKLAIAGLVSEDVLVESDGGYLLKEDAETLKTYTAPEFHSVYALHRNDPLYKAFEPALKSLAKSLTEGLPYDCDPLQYLLIDGVFHGAVVGHFRNGPYDLNDVRIDDASLLSWKEDIIAAVQTVNFGALPQRFMGEKP